MDTTKLLFSYGTLQSVEVQIETFGRELAGSNDVLLGYKLNKVKINDQNVVVLSGESYHPIAVVTCDCEDEIPGVVFEITTEELAQSDKYEVDEYQRVMGKLKSGKSAWVYVSADDDTRT